MSKEAKTLKEWFGDATRGDGRKFRQSLWAEGVWFEPIIHVNNLWIGIENDGKLIVKPDFFLLDIYTEPKKTEMRWLWASKDGEICDLFSTAPVRTLRNKSVGTDVIGGVPLERIRNEDVFFDIKLEFSATEFEVD